MCQKHSMSAVPLPSTKSKNHQPTTVQRQHGAGVHARRIAVVRALDVIESLDVRQIEARADVALVPVERAAGAGLRLAVQHHGVVHRGAAELIADRVVHRIGRGAAVDQERPAGHGQD